MWHWVWTNEKKKTDGRNIMADGRMTDENVNVIMDKTTC